MPAKQSKTARKGSMRKSKFVQSDFPGQDPELKFVDTNISTASNVNDTYYLLNPVTTGIDYNQMIGRKARVKHIDLVGSWQAFDQVAAGAPSVNFIGPTQLRCTLVYDRQTDGLPIVYTDVFQAGIASSPQDMNTKNRFVVLYDSHSVHEGVSSYSPVAPFGCQAEIKNSLVQFHKNTALDLVKRGVTAAIGDVESGSIWLIVHNDIVFAGTMIAPSFRGYARVLFEDM
jgi:hypothetical protein